MKTFTLAFAFLASLPLAASAQVSKEDIKKLASAGISDDVILSYVKANGGMAKLSAEDVVELKKAGASEKLLSSILSVSTEPQAPAAAERKPAPAITPTYATDSTPYYYTPASVYYSDYYYPSTYYYPYYSYYPRYYYSSSCYPRSYYYSSCYPRSYYYSPGVSIGISAGRYYGGRGYVGVSGYRR